MTVNDFNSPLDLNILLGINLKPSFFDLDLDRVISVLFNICLPSHVQKCLYLRYFRIYCTPKKKQFG